jgi:hypothetical protein
VVRRRLGREKVPRPRPRPHPRLLVPLHVSLLGVVVKVVVDKRFVRPDGGSLAPLGTADGTATEELADGVAEAAAAGAAFTEGRG